ncbi:MAG TPA: amino acid adenylation domain-containing protein [Pseudolabrys sp.]|nr:amino acid adenylation domain-containing protein [Pseudolabrys sp.]
MSEPDPRQLEGVAIIGMAGRFPGASGVAEFWRNQLDRVESISFFAPNEVEVVPDAVAGDAAGPDPVRARAILADVDLFDADFFGIYPREAALMDPQHRLFLEACWQAFEDAAYDPQAFAGSVGVFAGCSLSSYFLSRLCTQPDFIRNFTGGYQVSHYPEMMGNSLDFLSTRVSYKLNLRGPSFTMVSACSTSLVAVTQACQSLLTYQCDMALAGGASITLPQKRGYPYQPGGMVSPDGHCRTFDADAQGTVFGSGVGVVLLKRVEDAVRDGDHIHAVIRGFGVTNDGADKAGYTAPSIQGQASAIMLAHEAAGIDPETIGYVEAHGTGTPLGDPIELTALAQAFRARTDKRQFCTIGSVKPNVGHLDIAAGVTGLIHATLVVRDGVVPPLLHFRKPNPKFPFEESPFRITTARTAWPSDTMPRRAGVSAFGVGGTNAHVVIEEAPERMAVQAARTVQLLPVSARSNAALDQAVRNLADHLRASPDAELADVAWTLQVGRRGFPMRRVVIARDIDEAVAALSRPQSARQALDNPSVAFLFPGQGSQRLNMAREVYDTEAVFREIVDQCAQLLQPHLGLDLRAVLYPPVNAEPVADITQTALAQPAIFVVEYALARLWMSWGVRPAAMLGHSIGEFVAACLAGVLSLEDALALVALRGRLMQDLPTGGMLSVRLPEADLRQRLPDTLSLAAVNAPALCVVAGPHDELDRFARALSDDGIVSSRLVTSHAFHSAMMEPAVEPLKAAVGSMRLNAPAIPYVSSVTGRWITADEATDAGYWARHARQAVQFSAAVAELRQQANLILLEVGQGRVLGTLARQHPSSAEQSVVSSLAGDAADDSEARALLSAAGALWASGVSLDWQEFHGGQRNRVPLPTYPFERKRFWLDDAEPPLVGISETNITSPTASQISEDVRAVSTSTLSPTSSEPSGREARIRAALAEIFEELSGIDLTDGAGATTFLELGLDSLFLTQVTQAVQSKLNLKLTFSQLLGDQSSLDALTAYAHENLPPEAFAEIAQPVAAPVVDGTTSAAVTGAANSQPAAAPSEISPGTAVERLLHEQVQAMTQLFAQQLDVLRGGVSPAIAAPAAAPAAVSPSASPSATTRAAPSAAPPAPAGKTFERFRPIQRGASNALTELQQQRLGQLVERSNARMAKSRQMTQTARSRLADPRVVSGFRSQWKDLVYPIVTDRSQGARIWDIDGNAYIDLVNGFGPIMLGHRPPFVEAAIEKQLRAGFETGPQTPLAGEVATLICEMTGSDRVTFCNTGSEAVMAGLRVARTVTGRSKAVMFTGDYHGLFDEVLAKGITTKGGDLQSIPISPGIPRESVANMVVLDYGTDASLDWLRRNGKDVAVVLVEPVQSRHPDFQPVEFLKEVRRITQEAGTALLFDEVVTGFRSHPGGCQALFDIKADLATYGKVVAGGMPIGILAGSSKFMDALDGGAWQYGDESYPEVGVTFFAGTFVRHPLTLAAAKAVLDHLKEQGPALQESLNTRTSQLVARLNDICTQWNLPTHIEHFGSVFYFGFGSEERFANLFYFYMRERGIHIKEAYPCFLTTAHTDEDIETIVRAFRESAIEMRSAGFFGEPLEASPPANIALATESGADAPLTESQLEVWLSDQLGSEASCSYNESFSLHLKGPIDADVLVQALQLVVGRHDALCARFGEEGDFQHLGQNLALVADIVDLSDLTPDDRDARLQLLLRDEAVTPFRLNSGPLVRSKLLRMTPQHHILVVTAHHIVCDGWSTNVVLKELSTAYSALKAGRPVDLPEPTSFSRYARFQTAFFSSPEGEKVETYWLHQFKLPPPLLELPTDRSRPAYKQFSGATYRRRIGADAYNRIKKAGARQGCTLFVTLLTGFQILLSRLSGQDDIVVGVPTAGQSLYEQNLVGHCVNFLPFRTAVDGRLSAAGLLKRVKTTVLGGYEHQNYTYGRLVRKLALPRDPARLPLTEVQFNLERIADGLDFDGCVGEVETNAKGFVNFDIFLNIRESKDGLAIDCDYNTGLFDEATIARWLDHYEILLAAIAEDGERPVATLPLMTAADRQALLRQFVGPETGPSDVATVHALIERQAECSPDDIAVVFENEQLTFAELDRRANQLAHHLRAAGVRPGTFVGVFVERSLEMLVALLGVLKSGGAYVPMDPTFPPERLRYVLDDAKAPVVLTQRPLTGNWSFGTAKVICLDADWGTIAGCPVTKPDDHADGEAIAYMIYTSGSTGRPKGVKVRHRSVVNFLRSMQERPGLGRSDVLAAVTTLSFDIAGLELFLPLCVGAKLVIISRETAQYAVQLLARLKEVGATVMQATPVTWRQLIDAGWSGEPELKVLCGGEALPRDLANALAERSPSVWNMYGPTETTIWSSAGVVAAGDGPVALGGPIANTQLYVLDAQLEPVPVGVPGELHIGGAGIAAGYHNQPELTAEKFVGNPFAQRGNETMYKTGDLVRMRTDGTLDYLGRIDHQIKLRGFRIELGEIESVLSRYPGIREAVVALREDEPGDRRLVGYLVPESGSVFPASADLRSFLLAQLPAYMAPAAYVAIDAVPLTPNGKVDRRALPVPDWDRQARRSSFVAPRDKMETAMAAVWAEVLRLEQVGVEDNLFELGADSLHVFQIAARAGKAGIAVTPKQILQYRTIAAICADLETGKKVAPAPAIKPIPRQKFRVSATSLP